MMSDVVEGSNRWYIVCESFDTDDAWSDVTFTVAADSPFAETGRIIPAIKAVRARTGCGLKVGKDSIDAYTRTFKNADELGKWRLKNEELISSWHWKDRP